MLLYGPVGDIPFYVLLLSDTNTDSIWLGLMEDIGKVAEHLGLLLLGIVNPGRRVAHNKAQ